jgi:hypothetical protein
MQWFPSAAVTERSGDDGVCAVFFFGPDSGYKSHAVIWLEWKPGSADSVRT